MSEDLEQLEKIRIPDRAARSDFLIHWTGKDIDREFDYEWFERNKGASRKLPQACQDAYVERLRNTLRFGIWMTVELEAEQRAVYRKLEVPPIARCCFTELKLSESRGHARKFGRLGIGVKRPFLFERFGRPLAYFGFDSQTSTDPLLAACLANLPDRRLLNFFQPMNRRRGSPLDYELYYESEWRILAIEQLLNEKLIVDPRDSSNTYYHEYFCSLKPPEQAKLQYLIPLCGWFSMLIYPSIEIRNSAIMDQVVRDEIARIKRQTTHADGRRDHGNRVERGSWPIELNLDNCRDF